MTSFVKVPPPRQLNQKETLDSLNHWKTIFRNYFRRDTIFKQFLSSSTTWDPNQPHYGLAPTEDVTAEDRKDALVDFLHHLVGFLPHSYLTSKLVENTTKLDDCWDVITNIIMCKLLQRLSLMVKASGRNPMRTIGSFMSAFFSMPNCTLHL